MTRKVSETVISYSGYAVTRFGAVARMQHPQLIQSVLIRVQLKRLSTEKRHLGRMACRIPRGRWVDRDREEGGRRAERSRRSVACADSPWRPHPAEVFKALRNYGQRVTWAGRWGAQRLGRHGGLFCTINHAVMTTVQPTTIKTTTSIA